MVPAWASQSSFAVWNVPRCVATTAAMAARPQPAVDRTAAVKFGQLPSGQSSRWRAMVPVHLQGEFACRGVAKLQREIS
jgi:hypothetical protein